MRNLIELLEIVHASLRDDVVKIALEEVDYGLCMFIAELEELDIISLAEFKILDQYIRDNRPKVKESFYVSKVKGACGYYWDPTDKTIRLDWLEYRIKQERKSTGL